MKKKKNRKTTSVPVAESAPQHGLAALWKKYWKYVVGGLLCLLLLCFIVVFAVSELEALPLDAEGRVVLDDRNWLVRNIGTSSNPKYVKFGVADPVEGYHLDHSDSISNENEKYYYFAPDDATNPLSQYYVMTAVGNYETLAQTTGQSIQDYGSSAEANEPVTTKMAGRNVAYYTYFGGGTAPDSQEVQLRNKSMNAYIPARDGYSYLISIEQLINNEEEALPDEAFIELLEQILGKLKT